MINISYSESECLFSANLGAPFIDRISPHKHNIIKNEIRILINCRPCLRSLSKAGCSTIMRAIIKWVGKNNMYYFGNSLLHQHRITTNPTKTTCCSKEKWYNNEINNYRFTVTFFARRLPIRFLLLLQCLENNNGYCITV